MSNADGWPVSSPPPFGSAMKWLNGPPPVNVPTPIRVPSSWAMCMCPLTRMPALVTSSAAAGSWATTMSGTGRSAMAVLKRSAAGFCLAALSWLSSPNQRGSLNPAMRMPWIALTV